MAIVAWVLKFACESHVGVDNSQLLQIEWQKCAACACDIFLIRFTNYIEPWNSSLTSSCKIMIDRLYLFDNYNDLASYSYQLSLFGK